MEPTQAPVVDLSQFNKLFKALANDDRIKILQLLVANGEMFAQDIEKHFFMEQSTASHHLNTLLKVGIVANRKQGRFIYYRLQKERIVALLDQFQSLL